jgi:uncharacterized RDD family membrane protein YckC
MQSSDEVEPPDVVRFRVAGLGRRLVAGGVDGLVLLPVFVLVGGVIAAASGSRLPRLRELGLDTLVEVLLGRDPVAIGGVAGCIGLALIYFAGAYAIMGRTLGMRLLGLRVITRAGVRPTPGRAAGRAFGGLLSAVLLSLGFIWIAFDREKRGLHDWLAGTYVVLAR